MPRGEINASIFLHLWDALLYCVCTCLSDLELDFSIAYYKYVTLPTKVAYFI